MLSFRKTALKVFWRALIVRSFSWAPFSSLCLHSGAWVVFRFRAVFAALSSLRCASGPAGAHRFFALSPLRSTVGLVFPRSGRGAVFAFFFEPSRVSEALCRRQEPREGVPKRARACERGGEARRREPRGR